MKSFGKLRYIGLLIKDPEIVDANLSMNPKKNAHINKLTLLNILYLLRGWAHGMFKSGNTK